MFIGLHQRLQDGGENRLELGDIGVSFLYRGGKIAGGVAVWEGPSGSGDDFLEIVVQVQPSPVTGNVAVGTNPFTTVGASYGMTNFVQHGGVFVEKASGTLAEILDLMAAYLRMQPSTPPSFWFSGRSYGWKKISSSSVPAVFSNTLGRRAEYRRGGETTREAGAWQSNLDPSLAFQWVSVDSAMNYSVAGLEVREFRTASISLKNWYKRRKPPQGMDVMLLRGHWSPIPLQEHTL